MTAAICVGVMALVVVLGIVMGRDQDRRLARRRRIDSGLRYCLIHQGVIDVDQDVCDFAHRDGDPDECLSLRLFYEPTDNPSRSDAPS